MRGNVYGLEINAEVIPKPLKFHVEVIPPKPLKFHAELITQSWLDWVEFEDRDSVQFCDKNDLIFTTKIK